MSKTVILYNMEDEILDDLLIFIHDLKKVSPAHEVELITDILEEIRSYNQEHPVSNYDAKLSDVVETAKNEIINEIRSVGNQVSSLGFKQYGGIGDKIQPYRLGDNTPMFNATASENPSL